MTHRADYVAERGNRGEREGEIKIRKGQARERRHYDDIGEGFQKSVLES